MAKRRRPKHETRYQRTQRLIEQRQCGLLPLDFSISCPRRGGPEKPHPEYPGKVGFLTCNGCQYNTDLHLNTRVCTHPKARQVANRWLAEAVKAWEERQVGSRQLDLF